MKTKYLMIDWLIPVLGIAVVAGSLVAATTYLGLEKKMHADEAFAATLNRLYQDQQLSVALKTLHDGAVDAAAQRLDLLLCGHIIRTHEESASADERTRQYVEDTFRRIALLRPKNAQATAAGLARECSDDQAAAEKILAIALASAHDPQTK
jgi:hypothetical protein